jgi:4-amino-4-deoxy-L-arabinose transferase-like glycosyltransferase
MALLALGALAIRLPRITKSLWYDELWSTRVVLGTFGDTLRSTVEDIHPPLYSVVMFVWIRVFGDAEWAVRLLPLLAGLATILLMPALGGALASRRAGWIGAVLLALSPVHLWYSQEARPYALVMLLTVLMVLAWRRLDDPEAGPGRRCGFFLLAVALTQLHYFAVAIPAAIAVAALLQRKHRTVALSALATSALGIGMVLGIKSAAGSLTTESGYLRTFDARQARDLFFAWFPLGGAMSPESVISRITGWGIAGTMALLVAIWLAFGWRRLERRGWQEHLLVLCAVPGLLVALNLVGRENYYIERSALPSLPFFLLAVAAGADLIAREPIRRMAIGGVLLGSGLVLTAFYSRREEWTVYKPNPDWRTITRTLAAQQATASAPLLVFSTTPLNELEYYMPGTVECPWPPAAHRPPLSPTTLRGRVARLFERGERLTCGPAGSASIRLYTRYDSGTAWIDEIRAAEDPGRALLVLNHYWPGRTRAVLAALRERNGRPNVLGNAVGLEVFALE